MPDECDSSLRCGAESSDLPAVIKCTPGAMIFQISASAMMDDVNLISPTDLYWRKFLHLSASRCFGPSLKSGTAVAFAKCQKNRNGIEDQAAPQILWNTHTVPWYCGTFFYCFIMFPLFQFFQFVLNCIHMIWLCWVVLVDVYESILELYKYRFDFDEG